MRTLSIAWVVVLATVAVSLSACSSGSGEGVAGMGGAAATAIGGPVSAASVGGGTGEPANGSGGAATGGSSDTGSSDTGSSDTGSSDTGSSDTGSSDTGSSDTGSSGGSGVLLDGTCWPVCTGAATDGDWGWENEESCVISGSATYASGSACDDGSSSGSSSSDGSSSSGGSTECNGSTSGGSCPSNLSCPSGIECGCYVVSGGALSSNKQALLNAGADPYMLASAMMETELMDASTYADGDNKSGDSWNGGVCKQNWGMMRECHDWTPDNTTDGPLGSGDYAVARAMNTDVALDVQVYTECRAHFGDSWWGGHRNGASGLQNSNTQDIQNFKSGMDWTYQQLQDGHFCDDVRFWVSIPAIIVR